MIIVTVYPTTPYVVNNFVTVHNLDFLADPLPQSNFLSFHFVYRPNFETPISELTLILGLDNLKYRFGKQENK